MGICLIVSCSISGDSLMAISRRILPFLGVLIIDLFIICFLFTADHVDGAYGGQIGMGEHQ